jgi:hypothetical protein
MIASTSTKDIDVANILFGPRDDDDDDLSILIWNLLTT